MINFSTYASADPEPLKKLWQQSFDEDPGSVGLFFDSLFRRENTFTAMDDGRLLSALYLLPCEIVLRKGETAPVFYVFAAATDPHFRRRGLMRSLLDYAGKVASERGARALCLLPGHESLSPYYESCGYQSFFRARRICMSFSMPSASENISRKAGSADPYLIRGRFLSDQAGSILFPEEHIRFAEKYQYFVSTDDAYAMVCVPQDGLCTVSEFFSSEKDFDLLFEKIYRCFPAERYEMFTSFGCMTSKGQIVNRGLIQPLNNTLKFSDTDFPFLGMTLD